MKNNQIGLRYGRLTVIEKHPSIWRTYLCRCDCGNEKLIIKSHFVSGRTQSCGCLRNENIGSLNRTHGLSRSRIYSTWCSIKKRCYTKSYIQFKDYGGRGITVCDEWINDFNAFYNWAMSNGYDDNLQIDRIDTNGNYEPSNCQFLTIQENVIKRRNVKLNRVRALVCRSLYSKGIFSKNKLANIYGVTTAAIHLIIKGKNWQS